MNSIKDCPRGTANCDVLQEGNSISDHSHVMKATPLDTKQKEFDDAKAERLGTELAPDVNKARESRTTQLRRAKDVRPL